jgi:predicted kinase
MIVIVFGLPGSGKSYFAYRLAARLGMGYISSDRLRKRIRGNPGYSENEKMQVYVEMLARMKTAIKFKRDLVLDATFYKEELRRKFRDAAGDDTAIVFIEIRAQERIIAKRLQAEREDSEADIEVYKKIKSQWQPMPDRHLVFRSTNDNIAAMLHKAEKFLCLNDDQRTGK